MTGRKTRTMDALGHSAEVPKLTPGGDILHTTEETLTSRLDRRRKERLKKDLKDDDAIRADLSALVDKAKISSAKLTGQPLRRLREAFDLAVRIAAMQPDQIKPDMKKAAAKDRYENRENRRETAPAFVRRVYGHLLDGTFTRADLNLVDDSAMKGLRDWERRNHHLSREDLNLPTLTEFHQQKLDLSGLNDDLLDEVARLINLHNLRRARSPRRQK